MTRTRRTSERQGPGGAQRIDQPTLVIAEAETPTQREANLFHLLAHPARLALLDALRHEAACVCHLEALLGYPQAYISQQLAVLRSDGLIEGRREGWNVYYHVCDARLFAVLDAALDLLGPTDPAHSADPAGSTSLAQLAKREPGVIVPGCACPHCSTGAAGVADAAACDTLHTSAESQENR